MSDPTRPLDADAGPDEIEADIAATRARLADSVDALAGKLDVKAQAKDKVADVKATASEKVAEVRNTAQEKLVGAKVAAQEKIADLRTTATGKVAEVRATAQDKLGHGGASTTTATPTGIPTTPVTVAGPTTTTTSGPTRAAGPVPESPVEKVVATARQLLTRVRALPVAAQVAVAAGPVLAAVLLVERSRKD